jgi:hypothetical protein
LGGRKLKLAATGKDGGALGQHALPARSPFPAFSVFYCGAAEEHYGMSEPPHVGCYGPNVSPRVGLYREIFQMRVRSGALGQHALPARPFGFSRRLMGARSPIKKLYNASKSDVFSHKPLSDINLSRMSHEQLRLSLHSLWPSLGRPGTTLRRQQMGTHGTDAEWMQAVRRGSSTGLPRPAFGRNPSQRRPFAPPSVAFRRLPSLRGEKVFNSFLRIPGSAVGGHRDGYKRTAGRHRYA